MVNSGITSASQTPKIISQSGHHTQDKIILEEPPFQQNLVTNRSGNNGVAALKQ